MFWRWANASWEAQWAQQLEGTAAKAKYSAVFKVLYRGRRLALATTDEGLRGTESLVSLAPAGPEQFDRGRLRRRFKIAN